MALTSTAQAQPAGEQLTEASPKGYDITKAPRATTCGLLARTINGTQARAVVVPGFVNDTFILIVAGKKPYLNMTVTLVPVIYTRKPEYWRIEVVACQPGILLPTIGFYNEYLPLDHYRGTKGIEVVWADSSEKIDV
jgi:hypothetical protein